MAHDGIGRRSAAEPPLIWWPAARANGVGCWLVRSASAHAELPLVVVHGLQRGAREQASLFGAAALALGRPVIAPLFEKSHWPRYQQIVQKGRADLVLIGLLASLESEGVIPNSQRFDMFGFSGGAQFAHRFAMLHPGRVRRLSVASAGWYTFFDAAEFPYGLGGEGWGRQISERLGAFLGIPTKVVVGADDLTRDANLRQGAHIDAQQGRNRVERALNWTEARNRAACAYGLPPTTSLQILTNSNHRFSHCVAAGLVAGVLA